MSHESSLLIQEYAKSNNFFAVMKDATVSKKIGNSICGDSIEVYLQVKNDIVTNYSYAGEPSAITKAAAEFLGEFIIGMTVQDILTLDADWIRKQGFEVSHRRVRSSVSAILAARNALHDYLHDVVIDEYEDMIE